MPRGGKAIDITGRKFNRLTVIRRLGRDVWHQYFWECRCDCGQICSVRGHEIRSGRTKSCGCLWRESIILHNQTYTHPKRPHMPKSPRTPEHQVWSNMKQRCYNQNHARYKDWGGRGIRVCDEWLNSFQAFLSHVGLRPSPVHTVERINNNGDYEPGNVHWALPVDQARNRRDNRVIVFNGESKILGDWAKQYGLRFGCLHWRLKNGWPLDRAITTPSGRHL